MKPTNCPACKRPKSENPNFADWTHCGIQGQDACRMVELSVLRIEVARLRLASAVVQRVSSTHTYTYAILEVTQATFDEVSGKLRAAEYDHAFQDDVIDMHGIALQVGG